MSRSSSRSVDLEYRRVRVDDGPRLLAFWLGMSAESQRTYRPYGAETHLLDPWRHAAERYAAGPDIGIVAEGPDGLIVGLSVIDRISDPANRPNFGIGVNDQFHGKGIGTRLTDLVTQAADEFGAPEVRLIVVNYNAPAQHLYRKFGFKVTGAPHREADGLTYVDMIRVKPGVSDGDSPGAIDGDRHRDWKIYVVPGTHFDLGWCASPAETLAYGDEIIRSAIDAITGPNPGYRFTVEYAINMQHFLGSYPEYLETVKRLVSEGKLEVCASTTGFMHQVLDGELIVRQIAYAQEWAETTLGRRLRTTQHSDLSGYTLQFPQILARSEISRLSYSRFHPPIPLHWWRSPDGSRVLAANHPNLYFWGLTIRKGQASDLLPAQLARLEGRWPIDVLLMGDEYDCLMGDPSIVEKAARLQDSGLASFTVSTISGFFDAVGDVDLPTYEGEAPYAIYSIHAANPDTYMEARRAENGLATAEKLSALRELAGMGHYPFAEVRRGWEQLFYPHDHNVGGRHGKLNTEVRRYKALSARIAADQVLQEGMLQLITHVRYTRDDGGLPIVVYNPLSWTRSSVVHTYIEPNEPGRNGLSVTDTSGTPMLAQLLNAEAGGDHERIDHAADQVTWMDIAFVAEDVPPLGYKVFYVYPTSDGNASTSWHQPSSSGRIDGRHFSVRLSESGTITSLIWKERGIDLVGDDEHQFNEIVVLEDLRREIEIAHEAEAAFGDLGDDEEPLNFTGKQWRSHLRVQRVEEGPLLTRIILEGGVLDAGVTQEVVLYNDRPTVEFVTRIDWRGARNTQARIAYPFNVPDGRITYEVPFGSVRLGEDELPGGYAGSPRFVQKWIDVSNDDYGITFSTRSGDHNLDGQTVSPIVLRSGYGEAELDFWYENKGTFEFAFSISPHAGGWKDARTYRQGWEYNNTLLSSSLSSVSSIESIPQRSDLGEEVSFCQLSAESLIVTSLSKCGDGGKEYALRLFEVEGRPQESVCRFHFPIRQAWKTNLLGDHLTELPVDDGAIQISVAPHEIYQCIVEFS